MAATVEMQEHLEAMSFDVQGALAEIRTPTLVLHRRDDQLARFEAGQHYARRIPGARFVPLEGEPHHPWIGDCQSVLTPVLEFICQHDQTRTGAA